MKSTLNKISTALLLTLILGIGGVTITSCASTENSTGTGEYIDDSVITTKVKTAIFSEESLKVLEINVETFKGVVQLSGFVSSQADINRAITVARSVEGVKAVKNAMIVK